MWNNHKCIQLIKNRVIIMIMTSIQGKMYGQEREVARMAVEKYNFHDI